MNNISIYDTFTSSRNLGDQIIMDSVREIIYGLLPDSQAFHIPTHNYLSPDSWKCLRESRLAIVGGTNLLSSSMPFNQQWKVTPIDLLFTNCIVLMGVGWWQYQRNPNVYTRWILRRALQNQALHSVRDAYTASMLKAAGVTNTINTGCPTMWELTPTHCSSIPGYKSDSVVFTLTDYNQNSRLDFEFIELLRRAYHTVYFWIQGSKDLAYLRGLGVLPKIDHVIPPRLEAFDHVLDETDIDYVGTRLHAGIRALQKARRSIILAIDNRAIEISKDVKLPVVNRENLHELDALINADLPLKIQINSDAIEQWKTCLKETLSANSLS